MRGVQPLRRLRAGTPLTPPLRDDPLRKGEGWDSAPLCQICKSG